MKNSSGKPFSVQLREGETFWLAPTIGPLSFADEVSGTFNLDGSPRQGFVPANFAMTDTSLQLFRRGHLPVMGEWFALPLIEHAGSTGIGDPIFNEIFHPISGRLVAKCDACLRIGGPSAGADEMVRLARQHRKIVYLSLDEIPPAS